jgi:hypothetical protein
MDVKCRESFSYDISSSYGLHKIQCENNIVNLYYFENDNGNQNDGADGYINYSQNIYETIYRSKISGGGGPM